MPQALKPSPQTLNRTPVTPYIAVPALPACCLGWEQFEDQKSMRLKSFLGCFGREPWALQRGCGLFCFRAKG